MVETNQIQVNLLFEQFVDINLSSFFIWQNMSQQITQSISL